MLVIYCFPFLFYIKSLIISMWHTGHDGGHQPRATPVINLFIAQESGNFSDLLPDITTYTGTVIVSSTFSLSVLQVRERGR